MSITLKGATFLDPSHPSYVEGKRVIIELVINPGSGTTSAVDAKKGGEATVSGVPVLSSEIKDEDGNIIHSGGASGTVTVTFGLVQATFRKTGDRTIWTESFSHTSIDGTARLTAFETFGTVWEVPTPSAPGSSDPTGPGTGLTGRFWQNDDMLGEPLETLLCPPYIDPGDDDYGPGSGDALPPSSIVKTASYSARWTGQLKFPDAGQYRFKVDADDGFRIYFDGRLAMNYWKDNHSENKVSGWFTHTAGEFVTIWIEFYSTRQKTSNFEIQWQTPDSPTVWEYIPIGMMYPTDGTDAPPTAVERPLQAVWQAEEVTRYA